jgi:hypothetical protein
MKKALFTIGVLLVVSSTPVLAKSGAGSGAAGGTAWGGNTGGQNQTWDKDSARGDYQQRARWSGGPP